MNKIKLLISNCKSEIKSLLTRVMGKEITHILVTTDGKKIRCIDSLELFDNENKIYVAKCLKGLKYNITTINSENVEYIMENYNCDIWDTICNINPMNTDIDDENIDRFYG